MADEEARWHLEDFDDAAEPSDAPDCSEEDDEYEPVEVEA